MHMQDRQVSLGNVTVAALWVLTGILLAAGSIALTLDHEQIAAGGYAHAVVAAIVAGVRTAKLFFIRQTQIIVAAFHVRQEGGVRRL